MTAVSKYKKVGDVAPDQQGKKLTDGKYRVRLKAVKDNDGFYGLFYIVEFKVLTSTNPAIKADPTGEGDTYSWGVNLSNKEAGDAPFSNIKAFICAALNIDHKDTESVEKIGEKMTEATLASIKDDEGNTTQYFENLEMDVEVDVKKAKKTGRDFARHRWSCIDEDSAQQLRDFFMENFAEAA